MNLQLLAIILSLIFGLLSVFLPIVGFFVVRYMRSIDAGIQRQNEHLLNLIKLTTQHGSELEFHKVSIGEMRDEIHSLKCRNGGNCVS